MNRRAFLKTSVSGTVLLFSPRVWCAEPEPSKVSDEEILAQTQARIQEHRQGDGLIIVRNRKGKAVRAAKVTIEQLRHDFRFGSNFFMFDHCGSPDREQQYRDRFAALLNYCTLGFYWAGFESERGKPNYGYIDRVVEWTRAHNIICKGHPLVWDHPAGSPLWLQDNPQEIEPLSHARVHDIVSQYQSRIDTWDVVNEPTHLDQRVNRSKMAVWADTLGPVPYVADHLKIARQANPNALLLVNDYRTEPAFFQILQTLRAGDRFLFDVVGIQSHMHNSVWSLQRVYDTCDRFAKIGLPLHFTEMTIVSGPRKGPGENWAPTTPQGEDDQARHAANIYTALFAHPAVQAITWWDFTDLGAWQGAAAGWLRPDMSPKPVYERLLALIKRDWWTKIEGRTDHLGKLRARAFYGRYRINVEHPNGQIETREVHWQRGAPNQFEFRI